MMLNACAYLLLFCSSLQQFGLGVAAGDVTQSGAVLWTRADAPGLISVEVATDFGFEWIVAADIVEATAESDLTLTVPVGRLEPSTTYYYRFRRVDDRGAMSEPGRFHTAPAAEQAVPLRFVFSGDTSYAYAPFVEMGTAADEGADFSIWFGDTIYADVPAGELGVAVTLDDYRAKYRQNRSDANVRRLLASGALWAGWDDHEVLNDYAGRDPELDASQRTAAYQAFFEYMPLSREQTSEGDPHRTYRSFRYGANAEFFLLDGRQYRDVSASAACGDNPDPLGFALGLVSFDPACRNLLSAPRDLLGAAQLAWLKDMLIHSTARVKFVVSNVPLTHVGVFPYDRWDGYDAQRRDLLEFIDANRIEGVIFLTTDIHANALNPDVGLYFRRYRADYRLENQTRMAEIIAGPWGTETLRSELLRYAGPTLGLPDQPLVADALASAERKVVRKLENLNALAFVEDDRRAYAVVDVSSEGTVNVTYRAVRAGSDDGAGLPVAETLYSSPVDVPAPPPCGLPLLSLGAMTLVMFTRRVTRLYSRL